MGRGGGLATITITIITLITITIIIIVSGFCDAEWWVPCWLLSGTLLRPPQSTHHCTLSYTALHSLTLCSTLSYTALHSCTVQYSFTLPYNLALYYTLLHCPTLLHCTLSYTALHSYTVQHSLLHCPKLSYTVQYSLTLPYTPPRYPMKQFHVKVFASWMVDHPRVFAASGLGRFQELLGGS